MMASSPLFLSLKCFIWDSLSTYFLFLFALFRTRVFRSKKSNGMKHDGPDCPETELLQPDKEEEEEEEVEVEDRGLRALMADKEEPGLSFAFRFQSYEEFSRSRTEDENPRTSNPLTEKSFCTFLEESEKKNRDKGDDEYEDSTKKLESFIQEKAVEEEEEEDEFKGMITVQDEGKNCSIMDSLENIDSDSESSTGSVPLRLLMNRLLDSYSDGFLSDRDETIDETELQNPAFIDSVTSESDRDPNEEYPFTCSSSEEDEEVEEDEHVYSTEELSRIEQAHYRDMKSHEQSDNKETSEDLESSWEHEELMEQLKIELENVKTKGMLPTIEEDSEYLKITEDLKPWKMEEKLEKANHMNSLHKFYKTYRERMRKFDMLNYQKMYAMGLLQLKNGGGGEVSIEKRSQSWLCKRKKVQNESVLKLMKDIQDDMEVVYVGQLCLSWDFLHLQYKTAIKLWQSDDLRLRRYSEVALQFQRFQVLMNRFVEEEPFRGPRVQYYVKTRCIHRNLLQIPLIKEDKRRKGELNSVVVSSDMLVEIIEECIRIFWRFLKADKDSCCWGRMKLTCIDVPNGKVDSGLLMEMRNNVLKVRKKLRRENCVLRKLKSIMGRRVEYNNDDDDDDEEDEGSVYFFSKVEVRLVVRVLNMSGLTMEQLGWCRTKLNNISFSHRTVHLGPSFLLFPA